MDPHHGDLLTVRGERGAQFLLVILAARAWASINRDREDSIPKGPILHRDLSSGIWLLPAGGAQVVVSALSTAACHISSRITGRWGTCVQPRRSRRQRTSPSSRYSARTRRPEWPSRRPRLPGDPRQRSHRDHGAEVIEASSGSDDEGSSALVPRNGRHPHHEGSSPRRPNTVTRSSPRSGVAGLTRMDIARISRAQARCRCRLGCRRDRRAR